MPEPATYFVNGCNPPVIIVKDHPTSPDACYIVPAALPHAGSRLVKRSSLHTEHYSAREPVSRPLIPQGEYRRLKARLTRAENQARAQGTPEAWWNVIAECDLATATFDRYVWPDDWSRWQRAREDALLAFERAQRETRSFL